MDDNNVKDMNAYRLAHMIIDNWLDSYSDSGAIWERSQKRLDAVRAIVPVEMWDEALVIARKLWRTES